MSLLQGQFLTTNEFSWTDGEKKDGSKRTAGAYCSMTVYEDGPNPASSPVVEVEIPEPFRVQFKTWSQNFKRNQPIKVYVEHQKKGKAKLIGWSE